jgi:hypothetical protein
MQRLGVGIHENVVVEKVEKNEKGTLEIYLKQVGDIDPIEALNSGGTLEPKTEKITIWKPTLNDKDNYKTVTDKISGLTSELGQLLQQYTTGGVKWNLFAGTGITADTYATKVLDYVDTIYDNVVNQFVEKAKPFAGENSKKLRVKLVRQSQAKHYPKFPSQVKYPSQFLEPMDVPAAASKLKYTDYEIKNNLHSGERIAAPVASSADAKSAASLFA